MMTILVAYASRRGSTAEIARAVAERIRESGFQVDCMPVDEVPDLGPYDAVVVGSALYMNRWRSDATSFLRRHEEELSRRPLWVFSSGPVGAPDEQASPEAWAEPAKVAEAAERLGARAHTVFGGSVPTEPHGVVDWAMTKAIPAEYSDLRDWTEIRAWAAGIADELRTGVPSVPATGD